MIRYVFRIDEPLRIKNADQADPQKIGESLAALSDKAGGKLKTQAALDAARARDHPLHPHLEWNDSIAAEAHRREQIRQLIRIIVRVDDADKEPAPAFLSITMDEGTAYRPIEVVKRSGDLQLALMAQADRDLEGFQRRYRMLKDICREVESVRKKLRARMPKNETRAAV